MALFDNQREANLKSCVAMVEAVLGHLGHDATAARDPGDARAWRFSHGSAAVRVSLPDRDDFVHLRVEAPVMRLDANVDRAAIYGHLLSLHATAVYGAAFALVGDELSLVTERSTIDLDPSELLELVRRVRDGADAYDDALVAEFGGSLPTG